MSAFIALDLDGTLEDSRADMVAAAKRLRSKMNLPERSYEQLVPLVNKGMDELYRKCFDDYIAEGEGDWERRYDEVQWLYDDDYLNHVADQTKLYPGVAEALDRLEELGRLAVVTNKPERISRRLLDTLGIGVWIPVVIGGDSCGVTKPDPQMLKEAAKALKWAGTGRSFMAGDTAGDIKMGRAFGATTIWCAWGYTQEPDEKPDLIAREPKDLPIVIKGALDAVLK